MKKLLIHWLGGFTEEESRESDTNSYDMGAFTAYDAVLEKLKKLYGKPANRQLNELWDFLTEKKTELEPRNMKNGEK